MNYVFVQKLECELIVFFAEIGVWLNASRSLLARQLIVVGCFRKKSCSNELINHEAKREML